MLSLILRGAKSPPASHFTPWDGARSKWSPQGWSAGMPSDIFSCLLAKVQVLLCYRDGNGTEHSAFDEVCHIQALSSLQISSVWITLLLIFILFCFNINFLSKWGDVIQKKRTHKFLNSSNTKPSNTGPTFQCFPWGPTSKCGCS